MPTSISVFIVIVASIAAIVHAYNQRNYFPDDSDAVWRKRTGGKQ